VAALAIAVIGPIGIGSWFFFIDAKLESIATRQWVDPFSFAVIDVGLGDNERAFKRLDEALATNSFNLLFVRTDSRFDRLRSDPRFLAFVKRAGLA